MRLSERLMYIAGGFLAVFELIISKEFIFLPLNIQRAVGYSLISVIFVVALIGARYEGIRFQQYLFLMSYIWIAFLVFTDSHSMIALAVFSFVLTLSVLNNILFGEATFNHLKMVGPYQVGHQDIHTSLTGIAVSVYYPMDTKEYKVLINKRHRNTRWLRYGQHQLIGLSKAAADIGSKTHPPTCIFNYLRRIRMDTV
jgi:hypothetical protein